VNRLDRQVADVGGQLFQMQRGIGDAAFLLVLIQVLGCGPPKCAFRPYSVDDRLPDFLRFLCEVFFRLCKAAFSSAFANADTSDLFVDMPDSVALVESGRTSALKRFLSMPR